MLSQYTAQIESLAQDMGLDYFPVEFEVVPPSFMMEVAIYGLPVRMPHWSFGIRYIYQFVQHRMGHSKIFEVVFPGNPGRAFLSNTNSISENTLVAAHVLGHADFAKNNMLFRKTQEQVGYHIVEQAAAHAHDIEWAINEHGQDRVEAILDAALALEQYIDTNKSFNRPLYSTKSSDVTAQKGESNFQGRFNLLPGEHIPETHHPRIAANLPIPPHPESDLLWFIAHYAPEMADWERDILLAVRAESFYFQPVFSCNIINEGWASYWHARLLREASFLPNGFYLDALKTHSDVVRPFAGETAIALAINPYHLGFCLWEKIIESKGLEDARRIMTQEDDVSFVNNYLDRDMARELGLFVYFSRQNGEIKVQEWDMSALYEAILSPKYNFGAPRITVENIATDGTLSLAHDYHTDGTGLDAEYARKVLGYIYKIWRRPVTLRTIEGKGKEILLKSN